MVITCYNYHKPKREIVVMFTNWTLSWPNSSYFQGQRPVSWFFFRSVNANGPTPKPISIARGQLGPNVQDVVCALWEFVTYHLVMTNIAMENGPFIDGLPGFTY